MQAGDKNPCRWGIGALTLDELADAYVRQNKFYRSIFQEAYQNALKEPCYKHLHNKYCRVEFIRADTYTGAQCMIIEFHFNGYPAEDAEWEENGLVNIYDKGPVKDTFRMYEYELVDYIK